MQIVPRAKLKAYMVSDQYDYDQQFTRVFSIMADAIMADAPPEVTHFVFTDHENGDDVTVSGWDIDRYDGEHIAGPSKALVPCQDDESGYFGVDSHWPAHFDESDPRRLYNCYLGGSPLASAPGFVISTAIMVGTE